MENRGAKKENYLFTERVWEVNATKTLLRATKGVDQTCTSIVSTKPKFSFGNQDVLERALYKYAHRILQLQRERTVRKEALHSMSKSSSVYSRTTMSPFLVPDTNSAPQPSAMLQGIRSLSTVPTSNPSPVPTTNPSFTTDSSSTTDNTTATGIVINTNDSNPKAPTAAMDKQSLDAVDNVLQNSKKTQKIVPLLDQLKARRGSANKELKPQSSPLEVKSQSMSINSGSSSSTTTSAVTSATVTISEAEKTINNNINVDADSMHLPPPAFLATLANTTRSTTSSVPSSALLPNPNQRLVQLTKLKPHKKAHDVLDPKFSPLAQFLSDSDNSDSETDRSDRAGNTYISPYTVSVTDDSSHTLSNQHKLGILSPALGPLGGTIGTGMMYLPPPSLMPVLSKAEHSKHVKSISRNSSNNFLNTLNPGHQTLTQKSLKLSSSSPRSNPIPPPNPNPLLNPFESASDTASKAHGKSTPHAIPILQRNISVDSDGAKVVSVDKDKDELASLTDHYDQLKHSLALVQQQIQAKQEQQHGRNEKNEKYIGNKNLHTIVSDLNISTDVNGAERRDGLRLNSPRVVAGDDDHYGPRDSMSSISNSISNSIPKHRSRDSSSSHSLSSSRSDLDTDSTHLMNISMEDKDSQSADGRVGIPLDLNAHIAQCSSNVLDSRLNDSLSDNEYNNDNFIGHTNDSVYEPMLHTGGCVALLRIITVSLSEICTTLNSLKYSASFTSWIQRRSSWPYIAGLCLFYFLNRHRMAKYVTMMLNRLLLQPVQLVLDKFHLPSVLQFDISAKVVPQQIHSTNNTPMASMSTSAELSGLPIASSPDSHASWSAGYHLPLPSSVNSSMNIPSNISIVGPPGTVKQDISSLNASLNGSQNNQNSTIKQNAMQQSVQFTASASLVGSIITTTTQYALLPSLIYALHRWTLRMQLRRLRMLHARLSIVLRLWHICAATWEDRIAAGNSARKSNEQEYSTHGALNRSRGSPHSPLRGPQSNHSSQSRISSRSNSRGGATRKKTHHNSHHMQQQQQRTRMNISQWMLEKVPPNLNDSFWYTSYWRLHLVKYSLDVATCTMAVWHQAFGLRSIGIPFTVATLFYYALQPNLSAQTCSEILATPDIRFIKSLWRMIDSYLCRFVIFRLLPSGFIHKPSTNISNILSTNQLNSNSNNNNNNNQEAIIRRFYLTDISDYDGGLGRKRTSDSDAKIHTSLSSSSSMLSSSKRTVHSKHHTRSYRGKDGNTHHTSVGGQMHRRGRQTPIRVTVLCGVALNSAVNEKIGGIHNLTNAIDASSPMMIGTSSNSVATTIQDTESSSSHGRSNHSDSVSSLLEDSYVLPRSMSSATPTTSSPVVIYFHGGGSIGSFPCNDMRHLSYMAVDFVNIPILYIDYSLAPENAYPCALDECYDVFNWVAAGRLGVKATKIILVGESSGANLAVATCIRAIYDKTDVRTPDALVLLYPILNMNLAEPTPSRSVFMMDPLLPMNLLLQCKSVYVPSHCNAATDPCLSPIVTHDDVLVHFPPTSIMVGGFDPFLDDSVDFAHRLYHNGIPTRLRVYEGLTHAFLGFTIVLPEAQRAFLQAMEWIKSYL